MRKYETIDLDTIETSEKYLQKIKADLKEMVDIVENTEVQIQREKRFLDNTDISKSERINFDILPEVKKMHWVFMRKFHTVMQNSMDIFGILPPYIWRTDEEHEMAFKNNPIKVIVHNGSLYIRLPRIPAKYYRKSRLFVDEIRNAMWEVISKKQLPEIRSKNVRILNVFDENFNSRLIPDNDNYDIKGITDSILDFFEGGDFALSCSFLSESIRTDEVEMGTYIIVSEANGKFDSTEQVIEDIKQAF